MKLTAFICLITLSLTANHKLWAATSAIKPTLAAANQPAKESRSKDDLLNLELADKWHRNFVKSWNEWMRNPALAPEFALKNKTSSKTLLKLAKDVFAAKKSPVLAQSQHLIVNFSASAELAATLPPTPQSHRLSIRVLVWPKVLVNGNKFVYFENKSLEENYRALKKLHHYTKLTTQEARNEFSLAALSYMLALQTADTQVKTASKMHLQKPTAGQLAAAGKGAGTPMNIPGMPEGLTMMNMANAKDKPGHLAIAEGRAPMTDSNLNWFAQIKKKFMNLWQR